MNLSVTIATDNDLKWLCDLAHVWNQDMNFHLDEEEMKKEFLFIMHNGRILIFKQDDELIGFLAATLKKPFWDDGIIACERFIFVKPEKRKFIGNSIIKTFELWAKSIGAKNVAFSPSVFGTNRLEVFRKYLERKNYKVISYDMMKEV